MLGVRIYKRISWWFIFLVDLFPIACIPDFCRVPIFLYAGFMLDPHFLVACACEKRIFEFHVFYVFLSIIFMSWFMLTQESGPSEPVNPFDGGSLRSGNQVTGNKGEGGGVNRCYQSNPFRKKRFHNWVTPVDLGVHSVDRMRKHLRSRTWPS